MLAKVWVPFLVSTMSIRLQKELNVVEGNACNCFCFTWKLTYRVMVAKVSGITSWVLVPLLAWKQCKRWIPIGSMGCVHTHRGMHAIDGWGGPSRVRSAMQKTKKNNWNVRKIDWVVSQALALGPEHDKIRAQWALDVLLESMLERVWWCRRSKMESWKWTICCPMHCSNGRKHTRVGGGRRSHVALRCY